MAALADRLELDRFATFGISGGAAYAVATAAAMPNRVAALALASPMGPVRDLHGDIEISLAHKAFFMWLAGQHLSARALAATAASGFHMAPGWLYDGFVATLPPSDRDVLSRPALKNLIIEDVHEALRSGSSGGVADLEVFTRPWNVAFADARMPARVWQGTADTIVPPEAAFGLARLLPGATLEVIEDGGHFWIYEGFDDVLAWIADAWQDGELRPHAQDAALEPARP